MTLAVPSMSETPAESDGFQYSDTFTRIGSKKKRKLKGGQGQAPLRDRVRSAKQGLVDNPWMGQCQSLSIFRQPAERQVTVIQAFFGSL